MQSPSSQRPHPHIMELHLGWIPLIISKETDLPLTIGTIIHTSDFPTVVLLSTVCSAKRCKLCSAKRLLERLKCKAVKILTALHYDSSSLHAESAATDQQPAVQQSLSTRLPTRRRLRGGRLQR